MRGAHPEIFRTVSPREQNARSPSSRFAECFPVRGLVTDCGMLWALLVAQLPYQDVDILCIVIDARSSFDKTWVNTYYCAHTPPATLGTHCQWACQARDPWTKQHSHLYTLHRNVHRQINLHLKKHGRLCIRKVEGPWKTLDGRIFVGIGVPQAWGVPGCHFRTLSLI